VCCIRRTYDVFDWIGGFMDTGINQKEVEMKLKEIVCPKCGGPAIEIAPVCFTCGRVINYKKWIKVIWPDVLVQIVFIGALCYLIYSILFMIWA